MRCSSVQGGSRAPELGDHTCDVFPLNLPNTLTVLRLLRAFIPIITPSLVQLKSALDARQQPQLISEIA